MTDPFLAQWARTRQLSLGIPRKFTISPDGQHVLFVRTSSGTDPSSCLWLLDVASGNEKLLADPAVLLAGQSDELTAEERVRRERARERSTGITAYATDSAVEHAVFALSGRLWTVEVGTGSARELATTGPVADPRPNPTFTAISYVSGGSLHVIDLATGTDKVLAESESADVTYGLPEHVASESMDRFRGYWWAPDGRRLITTRVDNSQVERLYLSDPTDPWVPPTPLRYPLAGTANAEVTLSIHNLDGGVVPVEWDGEYVYVVNVHWAEAGLFVVLQNRPQTTMQLRSVDPSTGKTKVVREDHDPHWTTIFSGAPLRTDAGELVWVGNSDDTYRLVVGDKPVTPVGLQVRDLLSVDGGTVLFTASYESSEDHLWTYSGDTGPVALTETPGVHSGASGGGTTVILSRTLERHGVEVTVHRDGKQVADITSVAEKPELTAEPQFFHAGEENFRSTILFPAGHVPGSKKLPVLMDPYGGPAGRRVLAARDAHVSSQWWANQGYAVIVSDGRGTPGRGPAWDRTIHLDKGDAALADQIVALHAAAERFPDLDLERVGMRGWSYGGYLSALAVLRRPDVFHVAVAGAPVTDLYLYDTHYQERYIGHPAEHADVYEGCSLIADAPNLSRPLMLIHGLADDNVLPAHTLRLSAALMAAGKPHTVLPLPASSHMPTDANVVEGLFRLQAEFLRKVLL